MYVLLIRKTRGACNDLSSQETFPENKVKAITTRVRIIKEVEERHRTSGQIERTFQLQKLHNIQLL